MEFLDGLICGIFIGTPFGMIFMGRLIAAGRALRIPEPTDDGNSEVHQ